MKHSTTLFFLLLFSFLLLLSSCVSKKKHLEILAAYDSQLGLLTERLDSSAYVIRQLELEVAERKGENNALLVTQDKMQDRIIALDDDRKIRRALSVNNNIEFYRYQVNFKLFKS